MQRINCPISLRALWCGVEVGHASVRVFSKFLGRLIVLSCIQAFALFVFALLVFEYLLFISAPMIAVSSWLIVGAIAWFMRRAVRRSDPPPGRFSGGAGCPVPNEPPPLMVVGAESRHEADGRIAARGD